MDKEYLIHDKPAKALAAFTVPMIIGNFFQQFYTMADSVIVGRFVSEDALAAIGASYSFTNVFICVAIGGGVGAAVITGHYLGSRNYQKMVQSATTALLSFLCLSVLLSAIGLIFGRSFMTYLNTPENILDMATDYLNIYFWGLPFLFMYNVISAIFNAIGKSRIPLYLLIFSSLLNILLAIFMVYHLGLGVPGAAWATFIAQGVSVLLSALLLFREFKKYASYLQKPFDPLALSEMSKVALPSILQQSTVAIGMLLVQSVVNSFGSEVLAGFSSAMRVESLCVVPMAAIGNAMSSYTAQNLGAGKAERVRKGYHAANLFVFLFAISSCIILELFHTPIVRLFLGGGGTQLAYETGTGYLRFMGFFFVLIGLKMSTDGLLRGAADMKMFTIANFTNLTIRVVMAVTLAPRFGIAMVWFAVPIGWLVNYIISYFQYRTGKWKTILH
ncbi:MATE family efflux transporter [Lacrimispora algidixylanolytica]|uniref:Probable multidrug resistance protein NorM n=1 Tax=Lacrimispora algidixylanolytica TaxID=94868 RepID=A0A419T950_9FIRM|nr:MATE family efflux transporter [Lacrimispora algidixylanolytica]RKD34005.1 MATE family efflux transporter [Lacrimispora algidixylanolytica]